MMDSPVLQYKYSYTYASLGSMTRIYEYFYIVTIYITI